jgi:hypothetical protein
VRVDVVVVASPVAELDDVVVILELVEAHPAGVTADNEAVE